VLAGALIVALGVAGAAGEAAALGLAEWLAYTSRYVTEDGRVVDTYNGDVSHSEGQGYGMLLAVAYDDREQFDRLWDWTRSNLQVRDDRLFAWKWDPSVGDGGGVADRNNATDGDLLIAWALVRAGRRWHEDAYARSGLEIVADVRTKLVADTGHGGLLLPAVEGFSREDGSVVVNPSYWVFPALEAFAEADAEGAEVWEGLIEAGFALLRAARFGGDGLDLPPDWLAVAEDGGPALPEGFQPVFGYNAVRVPLYLAWSGRHTEEASRLLQPFRDFWASFDGRTRIPATVDLQTGMYGADALSEGGRAIMILARFGQDRPDSARAMMPDLRPADDYYASTLVLLSKLALEEGFGRWNEQSNDG
jgi:endoglucanase